jgi:hypothetical protein
MPYWCFSPVVDGVFFIAPGKTYSSAYRYIVFDKPIGHKVAEAMHHDLVEPPVVSVLQ